MTSLAGIVVLTRHGDRLGFYQSPTTYAASQTNLTVLGYQQEFQNGQDLRNTYIAGGGAKVISGISVDAAQDAQLSVQADGAGEGEVIVDSANALLQGLYPPFADSITLANGSTVTWDRTQLIRINTIEADEDVSLEGWTGCNTWTTRLNTWYNSSDFQAQSTIAKPFYSSLKPLLGNRAATLVNAWNVFDYLNVESVHNATMAAALTAEQLQQARYWANYHEAGSFSDADAHSVGNVAGQAIMPTLLQSIHDVANVTNPLKIAYTAISYKPFLALSRLWNAPQLHNVVDYASTVVIEVYSDNTLAMQFRNGTTGDFTALTFAGSGGQQQTTMSVTEFTQQVSPFSIDTLAEWCDVCQTSTVRGCDTLASLNGTGGAGYASIDSTVGRHRVSPVVAGVIGAMVTLAVVVVVLAVMAVFSPRHRSRRRSSGTTGQAHDQYRTAHVLDQTISATGSERGSATGEKTSSHHSSSHA